MTAGETPFYRSKTFGILLGVLGSGACIGWVIWKFAQEPGAFAKIGNAFQTADYRMLVPFLAVLFIFYWLKAWRWRILLAPVGSYKPLKELFPPVMIGFAFNNVLPAHLGEFVRCYVFARQKKLPMSTSLSSVVLERVFDIIAILFYLGIGLVFVENVDPKIRMAANIFAVASACAVLGGLCYVIWTKPFVTVVEAILKRLPLVPHSLTDKFCDLLEKGAEGLASLKSVPLLIATLVISLIKWGLNGGLVILSLWAFGISVPPTVAMVLLGALAFGVTVPSTPGYVGVIQAIFVLVLEQLLPNWGDVREKVVAASIFYHMVQYIPVTALGMIFFVKSGISLHQVEEAEEAFEEGEPLPNGPKTSGPSAEPA